MIKLVFYTATLKYIDLIYFLMLQVYVNSLFLNELINIFRGAEVLYFSGKDQE